MKTHLLIRSVAISILGLALLSAVSCSKDRGTVYNYYYLEDLENMNLPVWLVTNAIPLTPDRAVLAATQYSISKHPNITSWDVSRIDLQKKFGMKDMWVYNISLADPKSEIYEFDVVVLMDGSIWKPTTEKRH